MQPDKNYKRLFPELLVVKDFNSSGYYLVIKDKIKEEYLNNSQTSSIAAYKRCIKKKFRDESIKYSFLSFILEGRKCYINPLGKEKISSYDVIEEEDIKDELLNMYRCAIIVDKAKQKLNQSFNGVLEQYLEHTKVTILKDHPETDAIAVIHTSTFNPKEKLPFRYRNK